jgi:porin
MALPDDAAIGVFVNAMITDNFYIIAGMADANADSTDPFNGFDTFFNDNEYFKTIELGWTTSQDRFYIDNTHLTLWHMDSRMMAGLPSGWGANFSFAHSFDDKWLPFFRAGYADGGGTLLQKSVSAGIGYHLEDDISLLGLGFHWGQPNEDTFGPGLDDQYAMELFARFQVTQNIQVTPDIQLIINPALNPTDDHSWVFGLRARATLL